MGIKSKNEKISFLFATYTLGKPTFSLFLTERCILKNENTFDFEDAGTKVYWSNYFVIELWSCTFCDVISFRH